MASQPRAGGAARGQNAVDGSRSEKQAVPRSQMKPEDKLTKLRNIAMAFGETLEHCSSLSEVGIAEYETILRAAGEEPGKHRKTSDDDSRLVHLRRRVLTLGTESDSMLLEDAKTVLAAIWQAAAHGPKPPLGFSRIITDGGRFSVVLRSTAPRVDQIRSLANDAEQLVALRDVCRYGLAQLGARDVAHAFFGKSPIGILRGVVQRYQCLMQERRRAREEGDEEGRDAPSGVTKPPKKIRKIGGRGCVCVCRCVCECRQRQAPKPKLLSKKGSSVALVVVACQEGLWNDIAADFPHFVPRTTKLLQRARTLGLLIVHVRLTFKADGTDTLAPFLLQQKRFMIEGTRDIQVLHCGADRPGEIVLRTAAWDAFVGTQGALRDTLNFFGVSICLFAGLNTSTCILQTASAAVNHGMLGVVVQDACADMNAHREALQRFTASSGLTCTSVDTLVGDLPGWIGQARLLHERRQGCEAARDAAVPLSPTRTSPAQATVVTSSPGQLRGVGSAAGSAGKRASCEAGVKDGPAAAAWEGDRDAG